MLNSIIEYLLNISKDEIKNKINNDKIIFHTFNIE
jgi:hypothetical protein